MYFSTQIFTNLGYDAQLSGILAGVLNTVFAIASFPPIWLIERIGRRALMFWGALGCGACMLIYVVLTTLPASKTTAGTNWAAVVFIILYEVSRVLRYECSKCAGSADHPTHYVSRSYLASAGLVHAGSMALRSHLSSTVTSPADSALPESGSPRGLWCLAVGLGSTQSVRRSLSGRFYAASWLPRMCGTTAQKQLARRWKN